MDSDRVVGAAKEVGGKVESAVGDVTGDSKTKLGGTVEQLKGTAQNLAGQAKDAVRDAASQAGGYAQDAFARGRDTLPDAASRAYRGGADTLSEQVRGSPLNALLIAGAVGYGIAWLIHGRS